MELVSNKELTKLQKVAAFPCISIYLPTKVGAVNVQQNSLELKNALKQVEAGLVHSGLRSTDAKQLTAPAHALLQDSLFWENQQGGLVLFISKNVFKVLTLPSSFKKMIIVGQHFDIEQLEGVVNDNFGFYILALSKRYVKLFKCNQYNIKTVDLNTLPKNLQDALNLDEIQMHLETHSMARGGYGQGFHGHGNAKDVIKQDLKRYFKRIDTALHHYLLREKLPLVLATVDYFVPIYQAASTYPQLVAKAVTGNPENVNDKVLLKKATRLVKQHRK